ncbi:MAG: zinc ribbon domain-containing protein [Acetatifactor sp.]|nr:zinc ribbon domain-containing protein [Acetatifactor sp.]
MDFLNKLGDSIVSAGKEVSEKAKDYTDAGKIQFEISKKKSEINDKYRALGKKYYAEHRDEKDDSIVAITAAIEELHDLENKLADVKGGVHCDNCGAIVPAGSSFCGKCGAKIGGMFEEEEEEDIFD